MQEKEDPLFHELALHTLITWKGLVAFDLQGTRPSPQEEDLGSSWELPERAERQNRPPYCVVESQWAGRGRELRELDVIKRSV